MWRDYARQHGAIAIAIEDWRALSADRSANNVGLWLAPGSEPETVVAAIRARLPELAATDFSSAREIRQLSLRIFDRSFALTYVLEGIAIVVGLFGVTATYAGEALARAREFGMLRHLGVTRAGIARMFALESAALIVTGVAWGAGIGVLIAMVLIHRVNPQSFHWTMDVAWPDRTARRQRGRADRPGGALGRAREPQCHRRRAGARGEGGLVRRRRMAATARGRRRSRVRCPAHARRVQRAATTPANGADRYAPVTPGRALAFPRDFGAHPQYRTEWWYITGWLRSGTRDIGVQVTFFRSRTAHDDRNPSRFAPHQLILAHAALAVDGETRLRHDQRAARAGFGLALARERDTGVRLRWMAADSRRRRPLPREHRCARFRTRTQFHAAGPTVPAGPRRFLAKGAAAARRRATTTADRRWRSAAACGSIAATRRRRR